MVLLWKYHKARFVAGPKILPFSHKLTDAAAGGPGTQGGAART